VSYVRAQIASSFLVFEILFEIQHGRKPIDILTRFLQAFAGKRRG
jgi:hypothetical protein